MKFEIGRLLSLVEDHHFNSKDDVELSREEFHNLVVVALCFIQNAFTLLGQSTAASPIEQSSKTIVNAIEEWVLKSTNEDLRAVYTLVSEIDTFCQAAHKASEEKGDWWSYEAVEEIGFILVAISQKYGFLARCRDFPDEPEVLIYSVIEYFKYFPANQAHVVEHLLKHSERYLEAIGESG